MNAVLILLIGLALAVVQLLIGGVKMTYSLPAYTLLGLAGVLSLGWIRREPGAARPVIWCVLAAGALAGYVGWRALTSPVEYLARTDLYVVMAALLVYLLAAVHLVAPRQRFALLWVLFGLALLHVGVGVIQFKEKQNFMLLPWILRSDYGYRASGFYICPNHLAGLLELVGLPALAIAVWGRAKTWKRIVSGYVAFMALAGIAITGSRGGYLSLVTGLLVFAALTLIVVWQIKRQWFWPILMATLLGCVGVTGAGIWVMKRSPDLDRRLGQVYDPSNMRLLMWKAALDAHRLSPWTGTGAGSYLFYGRYFRHQTVQADPQHVHNDYLELLAEYGYVGAGLMLVFLVAHAGSGLAAIGGIVRSRMKPAGTAQSNELAIVLGILSAFAALSVHSVTDFNFHIPANALVGALFFGILANPRTPTEDERIRWRISGFPVAIAPALLGGAMIVLAVPRILPEYCAERARMALRDGKAAEAIRYAERALQTDRRNPNLYYFLGEAKHTLAMKAPDEGARVKLQVQAVNAFAEGITYFPADLQLLLKLARSLDNLRLLNEADFVLRVALAADPNSANVYAYYGYHCYLQRRLLRAEKLYRKAITLGESAIAPAGLQDIAVYRFYASQEDTEEAYPVDDLPGDEDWQPGEP